MSTHITKQVSRISRIQRENNNKHQGKVLWLTGLSGAGKSTLAFAVEEKLHQKGSQVLVLDGDNLRNGLCKDLDFSEGDRKENIRRVSELAKLLVDHGVIVIVALISPYKADRKLAKILIGEHDFIEIYCNCPIEICERRDVKGLYQKVRQGEIKNFTGIDSPYEIPDEADLIINTVDKSTDEGSDLILKIMGLASG